MPSPTLASSDFSKNPTSWPNQTKCDLCEGNAETEWTVLPARLPEGPLRTETTASIQGDGVFLFAKRLEYVIHLALPAILRARYHSAHLQMRKLGIIKVHKTGHHNLHSVTEVGSGRMLIHLRSEFKAC